jgi:hypothetical protein
MRSTLAKAKLACARFAVGFVVLAAVSAPGVRGQDSAASNAVIVTDFSNPAAAPSHWILTLHRDGSGHFSSGRSTLPGTDAQPKDVPNVDRDVQVSAAFADHVFQAAGQHNWFNEQCESHMKVAFQGWKKLSYEGPEGHGSCTFNYSKDKEIQALGDQLSGVAETLLAGARLENLWQHDPLGLDKEMEYLQDAAKDGRVQQIVAIKEILERLEEDPGVLDRVRKRARLLLASGER